MSRIDTLNRRYAASASLSDHGVEIVAVGDPAGSRLNSIARELMVVVREDGPGLWDDLVGAVKSLRWRLVTQPQPIAFNPAITDAADQVARQVRRLRGSVENELLLSELVAAAAAVSASDPPLGAVLLRSIEEAGSSDCVVVGANSFASAAINDWLGSLGVRVMTARELERGQINASQSYAVGPPRFFRSSLVTAPVTASVSFFMPAWFGDRQIPQSPIAPYADGAIRIAARVFFEGDLAAQESPTTEHDAAEDEFLPQPVWGTRQSPDREPTSDEVDARKLFLSGGLALWLDDGERIRALDPHQPVGERVMYVDVASLRPGTYLLLRHGLTEHRALYETALSRLGDRGAGLEASQGAWKHQLQARISQMGARSVVRELASSGVKAADRARAWGQSNLVRPHSDHDFEQLLRWLGLPIQPSFGNATLLRRTIYKVSAEIREQLETAVSAADLSTLEREGHLSFDLPSVGFRGILATRVLAISPYTEIVSRNDARVPFEDRHGKWLE
jgi:hypothetical protein